MLADVAAQDDSQLTVLHTAAAWGAAECVKVCVDFGADVNAVSADGSSALLLAAHEGFTDAVIALLDTGSCCAGVLSGRLVLRCLWMCCVLWRARQTLDTTAACHRENSKSAPSPSRPCSAAAVQQ